MQARSVMGSGLALAVTVLLVTSCAVSGSATRGNAGRFATASAPVAVAAGRQSTVPRWLRGRDWERIPTSRHIVALTFDAGSNAAGLPSIRRTLNARRVPASFFPTGQWVRAHPVQAKALAARYLIGNHSMTHPHVCGVSPRPLFRFPYGDRSARTITAVNDGGYVAVRWTVDTLGWEGTREGITVSSVVRRVLANLRPGEIVLMHVGANPYDHSTLDAAALPRVISRIRERGYTFVSLNALLTAR